MSTDLRLPPLTVTDATTRVNDVLAPWAFEPVAGALASAVVAALMAPEPTDDTLDMFAETP